MGEAAESRIDAEKARADQRAFIRKLIIGKAIFLVVLGGIGLYLFQTI